MSLILSTSNDTKSLTLRSYLSTKKSHSFGFTEAFFGFKDKNEIIVLHRKFSKFACFPLLFCVALNCGAKSHHSITAVPRILMNHSIYKHSNMALHDPLSALLVLV